MHKISLTPGKPISAGSILLLIFFLIFGIGFAVLVGNVLAENEAPLLMSILFYLFIVAWIGTVLFMLVFHLKNLNRKEGLSLFDLTTEQESDFSPKRNPSQNLRELESLRRDGLLTEKEYQQKRTEILKEPW